MCKNNFTNENEFDFSGVMPDSVCNPSGPSNLGDVYNFFGPDSIDYPDYTPIPKATYYAAWILFKNDIISFFK